MNAMQRLACWELGVSLLAALVVAAAYPFLGNGALGGFGLLGLLGLGVLFLRRTDARVIVDERDSLIQLRAQLFGVTAAWLMLFLSLTAIVLWADARQRTQVSIVALMWLVWTNFVVCYVVKAAASLVLYRKFA